MCKTVEEHNFNLLKSQKEMARISLEPIPPWGKGTWKTHFNKAVFNDIHNLSHLSPPPPLGQFIQRLVNFVDLFKAPTFRLIDFTPLLFSISLISTLIFILSSLYLLWVQFALIFLVSQVEAQVIDLNYLLLSNISIYSYKCPYNSCFNYAH